MTASKVISLLGHLDPSFRALSGRLEFTVRQQKSTKIGSSFRLYKVDYYSFIKSQRALRNSL